MQDHRPLEASSTRPWDCLWRDGAKGPGSPEAGRGIGRGSGLETSGRGLVYLVILYYSSAMIDGMISTAGPQPGATVECAGFG